MKTITITRKKSIVGSANKYYCALNLGAEELAARMGVSLEEIANLGKTESFKESAVDMLDTMGFINDMSRNDKFDIAKFRNKLNEIVNEGKDIFLLTNGSSATFEVDENIENTVSMIAIIPVAGPTFSDRISVKAGREYKVSAKFGAKVSFVVDMIR